MQKLRVITNMFVCVLFLLAGCNTMDTVNDAEGKATGNSYEGELISFVVPFQAGGGTDVFARFMTPFFSQHIDGKPKVQVENIPGGGSVTGTNEYALMRPQNGKNILTSSASSHVPYILEQNSVKYDLKDFKPLIGAPSGGVVYTTSELAEPGMENLATLENELFYAGISPTGLDLVTLLSFEVLGLDVKAVLGYEGRGPSRVAFEQGESNIDYQTTSAYKNNVEPLVEEGSAVPLYSLGQTDENGNLIRDGQFPDLPTVEEVYEEIYNESPSGELWDAYKQIVSASYTLNKVIWVHKEAPENHITLLEKGMQSLREDENFSEKSTDILEGYDTFIGEDLSERIESSFSISPTTREWIRVYLKDKFDVNIDAL